MKNELEPVNRSDLSEEIILKVSRAIRSGRYQPGEALIQDELAKQLNVSRTPLRDALNELKRQGLVEERARGFRVVSPTLRDFMDLLEIVSAIESVAARLAAARADEKAHKAIMRAASKGPVKPPYLDSKLDFHLQIAIAAQTPHLLRIRPVAVAITDLTQFGMADVASHEEKAARADHIAIANAIIAGDVDKAGLLVSNHWLAGRSRLKEQLEY